MSIPYVFTIVGIHYEHYTDYDTIDDVKEIDNKIINYILNSYILDWNDTNDKLKLDMYKNFLDLSLSNFANNLFSNRLCIEVAYFKDNKWYKYTLEDFNKLLIIAQEIYKKLNN